MMTTAMQGAARRLAALAVVATMLAGCSTPENSTPLPQLTVPRPTPAEMTEQEPNRAHLDKVDTSCDPTASLRPTNDRAANDDAVAAIRKRGRLIVGLDIGSNLFSFRDPITGELTGFDVDIAGEISRDIFGTPERVEYRILSSADRVAALKNSTVDIVVKTMTITCARRKEVNFSTVYLMTYQRILTSRDSGITNAQDLSGRRVCAARGTTSLNRLSQITPPPVIMSVVTWADCLVALQQRQVDAVSTDDSILAGLMSQDPYLHIIGPNMSDEPYGIGIRLENTDLVRFVNRTLERIRRDGTWNALYRKWLSVLGPAPAPPSARYRD
ncbi:ABC transporter glutamine-binding protein GlnH precursor [Mycobacteroides salmoniphilum]|uniref:ABC transporter glutamine-binding protein GlnH n=2 Tax=Mycobacteroides salmoniphilum TaxID=404941 RepID=A0A4R8RUF1_9MYCO|nr:ABC transporter glutamine-binding protein GlnH precursor [Mycobacteroides salmoniphilum]